METSLEGLERSAPTDARQMRSRNALTDALLALLEEKSFEQLTIREITARAGTGYATFFRHYPTKEALLADVAAAEIADLLRRTMPILCETGSYQSALALCRHVDDRPRLWSALLTGGAAGLVRGEFIRQACGLVEDIGPGRNWLPQDLGIIHGTSSTFDILAWWLAQVGDSAGPSLSPEQVANILHRLVIVPLAGDTAERGTARAS